jgi:hypothetical protein
MRSGTALYDQIRSEITATFKPKDAVEGKQVERVMRMVWCLAWRTGVFGSKPAGGIVLSMGQSSGSICRKIKQKKAAMQKSHSGDVRPGPGEECPSLIRDML